ncbi:NAD(P)/FAD-dependent oxidoreductase [Nocardioides zeae]|uniref:NAD(P)/FAD-dependent oxidoreductase n=1 Tax=Nocardioides imazamoxiresistens TaxID=3231893 RepID=A0ABU3PXI3_9ACTN|nr:NAD(P)/FAD-dependent oxidoreductase [Nocardioides zeae]MDT9593950.1 NAD(P)/FAD-dependent oxidoreductase [Nocardioides zeae]
MSTSTVAGATGPQGYAGPLPDHVDVLVIGAGFAGLAVAIKLTEDGRDVLVVDKGDSVGGTWRDNTYPGAACDVPSQLYSYSFAPGDWSRSFSPQPEIKAYLDRVAARSGVLDRFVFGTSVEHAQWEADRGVWAVRTSRGDLTADVLVSGAGGLSEPKLPDIAGIDDFGGEIFHSARWDHDTDLAGKRVAVIGTGASAIQIVPELQKVAGHLDVYQRTAPWVLPRHDRTYPGLERLALRSVPGLQRLYRTAIYWGRETYVPAFTLVPDLAKPAELLARGNIARGISDPDLRTKVTPDFKIGCKRILISNAYYPALDADNTELVTDRIERITPTGIVTADGTEREIDVLVVATGFHTTDQPIAHHVVGREGRSLADVWREHGQQAYRGTTVAGFPNFFQVVGPNTGLGHSSMVFIIESQVAYLRDALRVMARNSYGSVEPRQDAQDDWNARLHQRMRRTVWSTGGCASWYLDEHGRNTTLWPRATFTFRLGLSRFDTRAYRVTGPVPDPGGAERPTPTTTEREVVPA